MNKWARAQEGAPAKSFPYLLQISKDYDTERLWVNADRALPEAACLPAGYGTCWPYQPNANGNGISLNDFVSFLTEPMIGHAVMHEVAVEIMV